MTNPCFYLYPWAPKRFQYDLFFPCTHFTKQLFTYLFPSERSIHLSNSSFPREKTSLFSIFQQLPERWVSLFLHKPHTGAFNRRQHHFQTNPLSELRSLDKWWSTICWLHSQKSKLLPKDLFYVFQAVKSYCKNYRKKLNTGQTITHFSNSTFLGE